MSTVPPGARAAAAPSCHEDGSALQAPAGAPVVVLAGAPNVGKSTLFNALTGARRTVGNWPGTTVEVGRGGCVVEGRVADVVDLPGSYSLDPLSPDEALTREVVLAEGADRPDVVVVVASAAHLARSLYLVAQVRETALPVVVALTMGDVAAAPRHPGGCRGARRRHRLPRRRARPAPPVRGRRPRRGDRHRDRRRGRRPADQHGGRPPRSEDDGDAELAAADERFGWIDAAVTASVSTEALTRRTWSDRIDRFATAPVIGPLLFLGVMWVVFQATTTLAAPLQDALDALVSGPVSSAGGWLVDTVGLGRTPVRGLVVDGVIAGVGMLLTFVPLMALMFLLLALLEDSGYLARAAVVTDRMMSRLGLPGRAFLPIVVGFGCNVPAVAATRILPNARHRVLTALLVPFTSCSARLTVYVLLATTFFPAHAGTVVFAMYLVSILLVVVVGLGLRATLWRAVGADPLVIDLPPYQRPTVRLSLSVTWLRLQGFLRTASGIIVATVVVVWLLQSIPVGPGSFGDVPVSESLYAALSRAVSPLLAPAGFGQWEAVSALLVGFVAKEAVISSWAQTYALAEPASSHDPGALGVQLHQTFDVASGGHTGAAVAAFMVFLLAYTPCVATLAAQRRELGTRWTAFGIGLQLVVAWTLAVVVFQVGRVFW